MHINKKGLERLERDFDLESYRPISVIWHLRHAILARLRKGKDVLSDIDGREETKSDLIRAMLSGSYPYLVSEEGTGKTRLARSVARLLPPIPVIKGCPYHDDPKWERHLLCNRCREVKDPAKRFGIEFIPGEARFSRIQGNEYTNEAKLLGLKDIQVIANGASPSDPRAFIGTGILRANRGILMIDELPAIRTKVQVLLHPVLEEKKAVLEEYNWERFVDLLLIATGNPRGFSHVNDIPRPLLDRLELIFMDLPDEEIEKEIMLKERSLLDIDGYFKEEYVSETSWDLDIDYHLIERKVVAPWWIVEVLTRTVRYSRECPNLEKKPSIRGGNKAYEHTLSSVEMEGRNVARLWDAFSGLRLALRGRIGLLPDFIDFDNPERTIKRTEQVIEDMLRDVLSEVAIEIFREVQFQKDRFVKEIATVCRKGVEDILPADLDGSTELKKIISWMIRSWQSKLPHDYCSQREKDIFDQKEEIDESIKREYIRSAIDFIAAGGVIRGLVNEESLSGSVFVPKRVAL
nr:hypothetical protein [Desulfobacterales bacterium]